MKVSEARDAVAAAIEEGLKGFVGQTPEPDAVRNALRKWVEALSPAVDCEVVCDDTNNTPDDVRDGRVTVTVKVPWVWYYPGVEASDAMKRLAAFLGEDQ